MDAKFHKIRIDEFPELLAQLALSRSIRSIHLHHTLRPSRRQFEGEISLEAVRRIHRDKGWMDIAQHVTIDPDGEAWTGRSWNMPPASAAGNNGTPEAGPLMVSVVGDFNRGGDELDGKQRSVLIQVLGYLLARFDLPKELIHLHRQLSPAVFCPGTAVDWNQVVNEAGDFKAKLHHSSTGSRSSLEELPEFDDKYRAARKTIDKILEAISVSATGRSDPADAEPADERMSPDEMLRYSGPSIHVERNPKTARGGTDAGGELNLTPETRQLLRQHVVNLKQGMFSADGVFETTKADVRAIFGEHLLESLKRAKAENRKLRIMFYAHGGLTDEARGLQMAALQIPWWLSNQIYPIHFVWETGFLETIAQLLRGSREVQREAQRAITDLSDRFIEGVARRLGGLTLWSGMKRSAERANSSAGGAYFVAEELVKFCTAHGKNVELHAVGHSAGSIFHAEFIKRARGLNVPSFTSLHLLAPAVRVDTFKKRLLDLMGDGNGAGYTRIYTMAKDWELDDTVAGVYRKSLLYLIYYALEPERETAILGLEESLRADAKLRDAFGLAGSRSKLGEVIFSKSHVTDGNRASTSTTHGCFDNDPATMNSVARWILQRDEIQTLPAQLSRECAQSQREIIERASPLGPAAFAVNGASAQPFAAAAAAAGGFVAPNGTGRRRALCIGINDYPTAPLHGCVADAETWRSALNALEFSTSIMRDGEASREAIIANFGRMVDDSMAGDVVVLQFAGHGTQLPDANGDEIGQDSVQDEALCPHDFASGAFVIDDDIADIFRRIPDGVNVTCFFDCCHSGTIARFAVGTSQTPQSGERARFLKPTPQMIAAHREFRQRVAGSRAAGPRAPESMREVVFSACLSTEVAWESGGHGEFTVRAMEILRGGIESLTNEEFQRRVVSAFGAAPRQHPYLDCSPSLRQVPLLRHISTAANRASRTSPGATSELAAVARMLRAAVAAIDFPT
jgi:Caspase domain/N-acetylmuramoyl-L-alanine amidase